jgi:hypothetical protein
VVEEAAYWVSRRKVRILMKGSRCLRVGVVLASVILGLIVPATSALAVRIGDNEGCTPGFWKNNIGRWEEYSPNWTLGSVFVVPTGFSSLADDTLLDALSYGGGPTLQGKAKLLLKQAVASILNAAHEGVGYPYRRFVNPFAIVPTVNAALASGSRTTMEALKNTLDRANNLGCPLRADEAG